MKNDKLVNSAFRIPNFAKLLKWLAPLGLLAYVYYPTFLWMVERWTARDSYYGHGPLIPLVSLYWIWMKYRKGVLNRDNPEDRQACLPVRQGNNACPLDSGPSPVIARSPGGATGQSHLSFFLHNIPGLVMILFAAAMQIAAFALRFYFLSAVSLVILLMGGVYFLFGRKVFREIWFPMAFLFFMVPLPLLMVAEITLKFKLWVAQIATALINGTGIQAVREGSYIYTPHSVLLVGDPCSGLRSFLAFLCLGFVFAYDDRLAIWKRAVLVVAGLPLAVLSNILRVFFLGLVGEIYGMEHTGPGAFPHDASGVAVFVLALILFLAFKRQLEKIHVREK
ncbi:MAG: exosortase/archaeosortase family protein [Candidatus Omnitrophica bacterium]|nr:exosortase/archaeosortase family protein [Smithellaceae bacterium]MDD5670898.1 exosortase/archaeosortase family protein [Candidatus Omnitrophota bacterium]